MAFKQTTLELSISDIGITGENPRKDFDKEHLGELAQSIGEKGIWNPLIVRPGKNGKVELIAGERRLRAAKMAGLKKVPVIVRDCSDEELTEIMLLENLQRQDLNAVEEADALGKMVEKGANVEDLAKQVGKSENWIDNRLKLAGAPENLKKLIVEHQVPKKAILELTPYLGWAIMTPISDRLEKHLKESYEHEITLHSFKNIVSECRRLSSYAFVLADLKGSNSGWSKLFDDKDCTKCKRPVLLPSGYGGGRSRVCLDAHCFRPKQNLAKKLAKADRDEKLGSSKGPVDLEKERGGNYENLEHARFDRRSCGDCAMKKTGTYYGGKRTVCMKPGCYRAMNDQARKITGERFKAVRKSAIEAVNAYVSKRGDGLADSEIRELLQLVMENAYNDEDALTEAFKPYFKRQPNNDEAWEKVIKGIPKKDLETVLVSAVLLRKIPNDDGDGFSNSDYDALVEAMASAPEVFKGMKAETHLPLIKPGHAQDEEGEDAAEIAAEIDEEAEEAP